MQVTYFQRKPRASGNFSIELVFDEVRRELAGLIDARLCKAPVCSDGLLPRLRIAWHARRHQGEINHVTGDTNFTALTLDGTRTILTNLDCGYLVRKKGLKRWLLWLLWLNLPVKHVAAVTTISTQVKEEIIQHTGCPPDKIHVIPVALPPQFKPCSRRFHAERPRILHLGTAPNKNLPRLIEALAGLPCTLVIIGQLDEDLRKQLKAAQTDYENHVNLSATDVVRQYEESDILAFPSLYEGFGLPILEAQAVGRPVLTSNRAPMTEVAGDAACLVDPTDPRSIRAGIDRLVQDGKFRARLVESGFENVKRFQPERIAQQYLALYDKVLAEANRR